MDKRVKNQIWTGCLCAVGCETLFGLSYLFTRLATSAAGAVELLGWRFLVAFAVMAVCAWAGIVRVDLRGKNIRPLLAVAVFSPVIYLSGEALGIARTSASESGVFLACIPVASLAASSLLLRKKPEKIQIAGISVTLAGVLVTVFAAGASATFSAAGYAFLTLAVVSYALYSVFVEKAASFSEAEITFVMLAVGAAVFVPAALIKSAFCGNTAELLRLPFENPSFLAAILYEGIGCSVLAFFLSNAAISRAGVNRTSSFIGVSTVVSIIASGIFLHEKLSVWQLVGAGFIIAGVYIANYSRPGGKRKETET